MSNSCNSSCGSDVNTELETAKLKKLELEAVTLELEAQRHIQELEYSKLKLVEARYVTQEKGARSDRQRRYMFFGGVGANSVSECIGELQHWHRQDPTCDIELVLNSPGGEVLHGLALFDDLIALRAAGHKITTVVRGMAASMGGILLQAGDERVIGKNSHVLIHEISTSSIGKLSEIEDEAAFAKQLSDQLVEILAERSTMTAQQIKRKWRKMDWWLSAQESVDLGFADRIG